MVQTATARYAQSALAVATRTHGADSTQAAAARRAYRTARLASNVLAVRQEVGPWTATERAALLAAIDGNEVGCA